MYSCLQAQYLIFERVSLANVKRAGMNPANMLQQQQQQVRLSTFINVPKRLVGKLVGKQGSTIRSLQQASGCTINLPKPPPPPHAHGAPNGTTNGNDGKKEQATSAGVAADGEPNERVEISGHYWGTQVLSDFLCSRFSLRLNALFFFISHM